MVKILIICEFNDHMAYLESQGYTGNLNGFYKDTTLKNLALELRKIQAVGIQWVEIQEL